MIVEGIELLIQRRTGLGKHFRCDSDIYQLPGSAGQHGTIADSKEAEAKIGEPSLPDIGLRRKADDRVVAMPAGELMKEMRRASCSCWQLDGDQQFLWRKRSLVDPSEKLDRRNPPLTTRPA